MSRAGRALRSAAGYTMGEMLVAAATIALVMAGLLSMLMSGQQTFTVGSNRSEAQQSARLIVHRLAEEVRLAGWDPRNTASFAALTALAPPNTGFRIANDWNATTVIETNLTVAVNGTQRGEQITYDVLNNTLRRQESGLDASPVTVATTISAISFQYFDADDVEVTATAHQAATAAQIRTLVISVTTVPDVQAAASTGQVSMTSTMRVRLRNR